MFCRNCGEPLNEEQVVCLKCGVAAGTGKAFCQNCGKPVNEEAEFCVHCGVALKNSRSNSEIDLKGIPRRSIATAIVLSLITCGIYSIYWFVCLTNDMNKASGRVNETSGGVAYLLNLITCGIYGCFWAYKLGEKRDIVAKENGSSNVLYLILFLFGFGIVAEALAQDAINKAIDRK